MNNNNLDTLDPAVLEILSKIDSAIKDFSSAELASSNEVVDTLLDLRLAALQINQAATPCSV